ncbi:hypothetical protein [Saccharothrix obliqua]|uniref:hypothetical protein n=1 Tax=Saccharothrix obliqua TaxID=2861747 RepID=UPI001C5F0147|nr:hypothetical protein [Saccharothrix obliqua]MBW4722373.1 hypothetical protein [Saccharothrix obliqua]
MTVNDPFKTRVRARMSATGENYMTAARALRAIEAQGQLSASRLQAELAEVFRVAGWPVEVEPNPEAGGLRLYAGPATLQVGRAAQSHRARRGDEHPDDPSVFDLDSPLEVALWAPLTADVVDHLGRVAGIDGEILPSGLSALDLLKQVDTAVAAARARDLADTPTDDECMVCGDAYHSSALLPSTSSKEIMVCPCCVFDGDLLNPYPARLALHLDRTRDEDLALPAGWAAVGTLVACLAGPGFGDRLRRMWWDNGATFLPYTHWNTPSDMWIWLPPADLRPPVLAGFGCGARLGSIIAHFDHVHPNLRETYRALERDELVVEEYADDEPYTWLVPEETLERVWPAAVAFAIALTTQQRERPNHRDPWHVLYSFESVGDWLQALDSDLESFHVQEVLGTGIHLVRDLLDNDV